jgi:hypothetical protein
MPHGWIHVLWRASAGAGHGPLSRDVHIQLGYFVNHALAPWYFGPRRRGEKRGNVGLEICAREGVPEVACQAGAHEVEEGEM